LFRGRSIASVKAWTETHKLTTRLQHRVWNTSHTTTLIASLTPQIPFQLFGHIILSTPTPFQTPSYYEHRATMSDATLPPPRSSSAAPASETGNRSDATLPEGYFDAPPDQPSSSPAKEEASGDSEGRTDSKQKRKRTRYATTHALPCPALPCASSTQPLAQIPLESLMNGGGECC
jgi:hypothetical protein